MASQHQEINDPSDGRRYFRGLFPQPSVWRLARQAGPRFWAGVLAGVGLGLMVATILVELELMTWAIVPAILLIILGQERLRAVVRRQEKGDHGPAVQSEAFVVK
jgi:hypothetical protein